MTRPLLLPGLPRVWRSADELQLGADPFRAVVVRLPDSRTAVVLDLLDGSRSERAVLARSAELDIPADQTRALLTTLRSAGLIRPAADLIPNGLPPRTRRRLLGEAAALARTAAEPPAEILRRRWHSRVVINGPGRLAAAVAVALAESGVGQVLPEVPGVVTPGELPGSPLRPTDLGRPRRTAIANAIQRTAPDTRLHARPAATPATQRAALKREPAAPGHDPTAAAAEPVGAAGREGASIVVELDFDGAVDRVADARADGREPRLVARIRDGVPVVGPFEPAVGGPCLHCLELHRRDRDASWPGIAPRPRTEPAEPCTVARLLTATAYIIGEILAHLDGGVPETLGAAVEIVGPGRLRRRSWPPHPACPCTEPAA